MLKKVLVLAVVFGVTVSQLQSGRLSRNTNPRIKGTLVLSNASPAEANNYVFNPNNQGEFRIMAVIKNNKEICTVYRMRP